ncbi:unnamed protein product [Alopecurus aequalis]
MVLVPQVAGASSVSLSCPVLTPENYTVWAIKVEAILDAQGVWEAVVPEPGATVDEKKNKAARAQLLSALSEDIVLQVSSKKKAAEVWDALKTRFVGADRVKAARLSTLRGEFDRLDMADGEELDIFAGKISGMSANGGERGDGQLLLTAAQWEARGRARGGGYDDDATSSADRGRRGIGKCNNCGVRGHFARDCWKPKKTQEKEEKALIADINIEDQPGLY